MNRINIKVLISYILYRLNGVKWKLSIKTARWIEEDYPVIVSEVRKHWFNVFITLLLAVFAMSFSMVILFHKAFPNRGQDDPTVAGAMLYNNPFVSISAIIVVIMLCLIAFKLLTILAKHSKTLYNYFVKAVISPIESVAKQESANIEYYSKYGTLKPEGAPLEDEGKRKNDEIVYDETYDGRDEDDQILENIKKMKMKNR